MRGRTLILGFAAFLAVFAAALVYTQEFAYYERQKGEVGAVRIDGQVVPVADYQGIDATSSPLKLRGCFRIDPAAVAALAPVADATPLNPPFWFRCFSARALTRDLAAGQGEGLPHRGRRAAGVRPHAGRLSGRPRVHLAPAQREVRGITMPVVQMPDFMAITCGLVTYLIGEAINNRVPILRRFNIPDPVTGGLLVAVAPLRAPRIGHRHDRLRHPHPRPPACSSSSPASASTPASPTSSRAAARSPSSSASPPVLLLVQNLVGGLAAWAAGLPLGIGVVLGSTSLLGGHGTIIAWSPELTARGPRRRPRDRHRHGDPRPRGRLGHRRPDRPLPDRGQGPHLHRRGSRTRSASPSRRPSPSPATR